MHQDRGGQYDIIALYFAVDILTHIFCKSEVTYTSTILLSSKMFEDSVFTAKRFRGRRKKLHDHLEKN